MISIEECRALIPGSETLTDEEITEIRKDHYEMIQLAFEVWWETKKKKQ